MLVEGIRLLVRRYWHCLLFDVRYQLCAAYIFNVLRSKVRKLLAFVEAVSRQVLLLLVGPPRVQVCQIEHLSLSLRLLLVRHESAHPLELTLLCLPCRYARFRQSQNGLRFKQCPLSTLSGYSCFYSKIGAVSVPVVQKLMALLRGELFLLELHLDSLHLEVGELIIVAYKCFVVLSDVLHCGLSSRL